MAKQSTTDAPEASTAPLEAPCCTRPILTLTNDTHQRCASCGAEWTATAPGEPLARTAKA